MKLWIRSLLLCTSGFFTGIVLSLLLTEPNLSTYTGWGFGYIFILLFVWLLYRVDRRRSLRGNGRLRRIS